MGWLARGVQCWLQPENGWPRPPAQPGSTSDPLAFHLPALFACPQAKDTLTNALKRKMYDAYVNDVDVNMPEGMSQAEWEAQQVRWRGLGGTV